MISLMLLILLALGCGDGDAVVDTGPPAYFFSDGCPSGSLLRMDWVDHDPEQGFRSGVRLVTTPGVSRVTALDSAEGSLVLEFDPEGHLLSRLTSKVDADPTLESFLWEDGLLREISFTRGLNTEVRRYTYNVGQVVSLTDTNNSVVSEFSVDDAGCIIGIGTDFSGRDPSDVTRQLCDDERRLEAWRDGLGASSWSTPWEPDLGSTTLWRDGIDGRPTASHEGDLLLWTMSWWPDGQLKKRDDLVCGQGFGDQHTYDRDGTLVSTRSQPCPSEDGSIPTAIETTWTVESCLFETTSTL